MQSPLSLILITLSWSGWLCSLFVLIKLTDAITLNPVERLALGGRLNQVQVDSRRIFSPIVKDVFGNNDDQKKKINMVLIFPGAGGPDQFTEELESVLDEYLNGKGEKSQYEEEDNGDGDDDSNLRTVVRTMDWMELRGSIATAAFDGEMVGETIASMVYDEDKRMSPSASASSASASSTSSTRTSGIGSIHCVGVSVGAFAANACATTLSDKYRTKAENASNANDNLSSPSPSPYLRLTLLDPFTSRGLVNPGYGPSNFGLKVDYAEQYLNTDDPVPSTNDPLPLCVTFDVTGAKERDAFALEMPENETMHCWPLVYFARYGYNGVNNARKRLRNDGQRSKGTILKL